MLFSIFAEQIRTYCSNGCQELALPPASALLFATPAGLLPPCLSCIPCAGQLPEMDMGPVLFAILGGTIVLKLGLWAYCYTLRHQSGAALALAEDHLNDVVSNTGAPRRCNRRGLACWWAGGVQLASGTGQECAS